MSRLPLRALSALSPILSVLLATPSTGQDMPLVLWTNATWPNGLPVGGTSGVSWGDFDGDGWVDFFASRSGRLWQNLAGKDWVLVSVNPAPGGYGSSFGDYNNDGLPDIATEPRSTNQMKLLKNLGGGNFVDVAQDPNILDVIPFGDTETDCWADVDFDGNLDLFVPVYPPSMGGPGNFFLYNLGPLVPGGDYSFTEMSMVAGLDNPPNTARPEGAQFCDVDGDGDLDMYCNATLYQNVSTPGAPLFLDVTDSSDIRFRQFYDEGCALFDHDLDGDLDLVIAYCAGNQGVRIFESEGDGTFDLIAKHFVSANQQGLCLGLSYADWDNDGDIDFTTRNVFRRNMLMETGKRGFVVATHSIPGDHITSATPAWADWDRDGDLDCSLGNWTNLGHFYENDTYDVTTPESERRYVRVRVLRDNGPARQGLETEFGAVVDVFVEGDKPKLRRTSFVSSSGGYLNQDEYTLHFALPPDPFPGDPAQDVVFDVQVDFNSNPAEGLRRVDKHVNPALGRIHLANLEDREIIVSREGRVVIDGCVLRPMRASQGPLITTTDGLQLVTPSTPLLDPVPAPGADWYVGLALDTFLATKPLRLKEVLLDGVLASPASCGGKDVALNLWDTTDPANPFTVPGGALKLASFPRNDRNAYRLQAVLLPGREYRVVARVAELRPTTIAGPLVNGTVTVQGGLSFSDAAPCTGANVVSAGVDASQVYLSLRFVDDVGPLWTNQGRELAGAAGTAHLSGSGPLTPGSTLSLKLTNAPPNHLTILVIGASPLCRRVGGGVQVPAADTLVPLTTDANGTATWSSTLPANNPPGTPIYFQVGWSDSGGPQGLASSNALSATSPF
jgi:hypothetical protein